MHGVRHNCSFPMRPGHHPHPPLLGQSHPTHHTIVAGGCIGREWALEVWAACGVMLYVRGDDVVVETL
jgi:hypothetical protein